MIMIKGNPHGFFQREVQGLTDDGKDDSVISEALEDGVSNDDPE